MGYSTCFIAAMAQPIQDRLETRRREREEMVEAIKKFLEANRNRQKEEVELEEAKRREWEERRDDPINLIIIGSSRYWQPLERGI